MCGFVFRRPPGLGRRVGVYAGACGWGQLSRVWRDYRVDIKGRGAGPRPFLGWLLGC